VGEILKGNRGSGCQTLSPRELVTCLSERGPRLENLRPGRNRGSLPHRELRFEIPSVDAEQRLPFSYSIPDLAEDFPDDTADRSADSNVSGAGFEHAGAGTRIGRDGRWRDRLGHKRRRASAHHIGNSAKETDDGQDRHLNPHAVAAVHTIARAAQMCMRRANVFEEKATQEHDRQQRETKRNTWSAPGGRINMGCGRTPGETR